MRPLPIECPSCEHKLLAKRLVCPACNTEVEGLFELPPLATLSRTDQSFVLQFVQASGSLKEMARLLGVSYPTVRSRLDEIIAKLRAPETKKENGRERPSA
jgi:hypothetical protein